MYLPPYWENYCLAEFDNYISKNASEVLLYQTVVSRYVITGYEVREFTIFEFWLPYDVGCAVYRYMSGQPRSHPVTTTHGATASSQTYHFQSTQRP